MSKRVLQVMGEADGAVDCLMLCQRLFGNTETVNQKAVRGALHTLHRTQRVTRLERGYYALSKQGGVA